MNVMLACPSYRGLSEVPKVRALGTGRWDPIPRIRYFPISGKEGRKEEERREGMGGRGRHVARPLPTP